MFTQPNQPAHPQVRGRAEWEVVKTFQDHHTGLVVEVSCLALRQPQYNVAVGQSTKERPFGRFIRPAVRTENALVNVGMHGMTLARLYDEASLWIQGQLQAAADREIEDRQYREQRDLERQVRGPEKKAGLSKFTEGSKTEREHANGKHAKHANNVEARRASDAEFRQKTKGRGGK